MANYSKSTNFLAKDSLADSDPAKIIKGSEFDTEFNNIVTAVNSKANTASPALTGVPTAPTASPGTNSTQLATTEFVTAADTALLGSNNTWTGTQTFRDNKLEIVDDADTTKKVNLQLSGITTATTRTLTVPNKNGTIALTNDLPAVDPLNADSNSYVSGAYSVTSSASITITATNTFSANQIVYITFTNTTGTVLTSGQFTIVSATGSNFVINYGSSVTSTGTVIAARYGYPAIATPTEVTTGTDNLKYVTPSSLKSRLVTRGTLVTTTSGTSADFTSIPSWVKRITVMFNGVSVDTASRIQIQLGTSSGLTTSGYVSLANDKGGVTSSSTSGLLVTQNTEVGSTYSGIAIITNITGNTWIMSSSLFSVTNTHASYSGGNIVLGAVLDRLSVLPATGAVNFDAGSINILYE